jgi:hypothetical protein
LDVNEDGVIDKSEFAKWYFTGMKSFSKLRVNMLKIGFKTD